jgi:HD superfamily phosphohydrolase
MALARQLGWKAYIDLSLETIHTSYSHSLGVVDLAGRLTDLLTRKLERVSPIALPHLPEVDPEKPSYVNRLV